MTQFRTDISRNTYQGGSAFYQALAVKEIAAERCGKINEVHVEAHYLNTSKENFVRSCSVLYALR